jgi:hypothetical protein
MVQLSATRCSCISILWVSLVSFAAITLCVAYQRVFIIVISLSTQFGNFWVHPRMNIILAVGFSYNGRFYCCSFLQSLMAVTYRSESAWLENVNRHAKVPEKWVLHPQTRYDIPTANLFVFWGMKWYTLFRTLPCAERWGLMGRQWFPAAVATRTENHVKLADLFHTLWKCLSWTSATFSAVHL